jgi:hypothetical protein
MQFVRLAQREFVRFFSQQKVFGGLSFGAFVVRRPCKHFLSASFWSVTANLFHLTRRSTRPLMGLGDNRNSARGALTEALDVMGKPDDTFGFRRTCGNYYLVVMLGAGAFVYYILQNQTVHARPPAIAIASFFAGITSWVWGWYFAKAYLAREQKFTAIFLVPLTVLLLTSLTAGVAYDLACSIIDSYFREVFFASPKFLLHIASDAFAYAFLSSPVWLVGLSVCSYVLSKKSLRAVTSN